MSEVPLLALSPSIWVHQFGEPGLFSAPKLTDSHRTPVTLTDILTANPSGAEVDLQPRPSVVVPQAQHVDLSIVGQPA